MYRHAKSTSVSAQIVLSIYLLLFSLSPAASECATQGVTLQILGSGGPELQQKRASSSYLIWVNGKARVLIDAGGGSALRFGESGAHFADLQVILLTHLHADHTADLPALIKSSYFESREHKLPIYGPAGNQHFPGTTEFINGLFGSQGVYRYLDEYTKPNRDSYYIQPSSVSAKDITNITSDAGINIRTINVQHGSVPALAWRIEIDGKSMVFSGDTNGNDGNLEKIAQQADIFVAHNAVPEGATGIARQLHMPPSVIGKIANKAHVNQLILSHRMLRTLGRENETSDAIKLSFTGDVKFADDLDCFLPN